jgi:glycosyltransferase involved in cell wall biosynthesis
MKIALYYPWIYIKGGIGRTILELKKRSRHNWTIFTSHFDVNSTYPEFKGIEVIELKKVPVERSYSEVLRAAITIFFQKIDLKDYDALWVHSEGLGDLITFRNREKPIICFCHTPLKVVHDPYARSVYLKNNPFKRPFFILFSFIFNLIDRLAWRNYHHVFCVSQDVKERILKAKLASEQNLEVIYRGVDTEKIKPTWIYEPYFFHPARIKWWKNVELSVEAFRLFQKQYPQFYNFRLVIAGQVDEGSKRYYQKIIKLSKDDKNIQVIVNPLEGQLNSLYSSCYTVLSTTLNEDWGITVIEAMGYGKPVIAVNQGGPKESIVDKKTGFLVEPTADGFAEAMRTLAEDKNLVQAMGKEAREHSLKYEWSNFISRIDEYIDSLKPLL